MPRIAFPTGLIGAEGLPRTRRQLRNCFNTGAGQILSRPGIDLINTTSGVSRGQFVWNGFLYQVVSNDLIKIKDVNTGEFSVIGTISGSEIIKTSEGFNETVIVVKQGDIYTLDKNDKLVNISGNPNIDPCVDVAFVDGRFVYIPANGDPAFFSNIGDAGLVDEHNFFDAEELPDKNKAILNFKNTIIIGGENSFELFKNTGATPNPFIRINGARVNGGFIGGLIEYDKSFVFIGRLKDQCAGIYGLDQGVLIKISNEVIDAILDSYTEKQLSDVISNRFKWRGYDIVTFVLGRHSFAFLNGNWVALDCVREGKSLPWCAGFINHLNGKYYTSYGNKIGRLDSVNYDYEDPITRVIDVGFEQEDDAWMNCQNIELGISQGLNDVQNNESPLTVALCLSKDNVTYGAPLYRELGREGQYAQHLSWNYPGGLGSYHGFMGARISTTENLVFSCDHLVANLR